MLWAFNPWDTGTVDSRGLNTGEPNHDAVLMKFVELLKETHADGINGDTMKFVPQVGARRAADLHGDLETSLEIQIIYLSVEHRIQQLQTVMHWLCSSIALPPSLLPHSSAFFQPLQDWWNDSVKIGRPMALEPEGGGEYPGLNWETMSVCHCNYQPLLQTVDQYKWLDARWQTSVRYVVDTHRSSPE